MKPTILALLVVCSLYSFSQNTHSVYVYLDQAETCEALSIEQPNSPTLKIYPNPADSEIRIKSPDLILNVTIYNLLGQKIAQLKTTTYEAHVQVNNLSEGTYSCHIMTKYGVEVKKIIISH